MARCYSDAMMPRQPLPDIWLISDARNDAALEQVLHALPRGSGFVFRHYHLEGLARRARFDALAGICREYGHLIVLAADADLAAAWGADGAYGPPGKLGTRPGLMRLATVHDAQQVSLANRAKVDAVFLSPLFPTRSHPDRKPLGLAEFHAIAAQAESPVIALGGINAELAARHGLPRWAAIDGLAPPSSRPSPG